MNSDKAIEAANLVERLASFIVTLLIGVVCVVVTLFIVLQLPPLLGLVTKPEIAKVQKTVASAFNDAAKAQAAALDAKATAEKAKNLADWNYAQVIKAQGVAKRAEQVARLARISKAQNLATDAANQ